MTWQSTSAYLPKVHIYLIIPLAVEGCEHTDITFLRLGASAVVIDFSTLLGKNSTLLEEPQAGMPYLLPDVLRQLNATGEHPTFNLTSGH